MSLERPMDPLVHLPALIETHDQLPYAVFRLSQSLSALAVEAVLFYPFELLRATHNGNVNRFCLSVINVPSVQLRQIPRHVTPVNTHRCFKSKRLDTTSAGRLEFVSLLSTRNSFGVSPVGESLPISLSFVVHVCSLLDEVKVRRAMINY